MVSEPEIIQITKEMVIVGNIYKQRVGITEKDAAENIILGFTGELRTWWDKLLSNEIKTRSQTIKTKMWLFRTKSTYATKPHDIINPAIKPISKPFTKMIPPSQNPIEIVTLSPKTELQDMSKFLKNLINEQSTSSKPSMTGGIKIKEHAQSKIPSESTSKDKNKITILTEYNETSSEDDTINNPLEASDSDQDNDIPLNTIGKRHYETRPDDLKILDRKQKQYNAKNIYEWNIDVF